jgi:dTDP-glucose 4,6-dehydratase
MRVIVTGGAGFIGSALVRHLVRDMGYQVLNIDALTYAGNLASLRDVEGCGNYRFLQANVCDRAAMAAACADFQPDRIMDFIQTNVLGTFTLLEATREYWAGLDASAKAAFRFLHVSTDEVYGSLGVEGLFTETTAYDPSSPYSASKAASDHLARAWHRTYGLPVIVSNCSNNYGACQFPEKLMPLTILNALEGLPLPVYGVGENVRDWLYVDDHVAALELIAARGRVGETYNVGGGNERRNVDVVRAICAVLDQMVPSDRPREELITFVADRPGHDARYAIDAGKLESELGWRARHTFESGLEQTVRWYLDNDWWWRPLRDRYAGERLGLNR